MYTDSSVSVNGVDALTGPDVRAERISVCKDDGFELQRLGDFSQKFVRKQSHGCLCRSCLTGTLVVSR